MKAKKINLKELILFTFSLTCGVTVIFALPNIVNDSIPTGGNPKGNSIGLNLIWILLVEGLLGFIISQAFLKLSAKVANTDGGAYACARTFFSEQALTGIANVVLYLWFAGDSDCVSDRFVAAVKLWF